MLILVDYPNPVAWVGCWKHMVTYVQDEWPLSILMQTEPGL